MNYYLQTVNVILEAGRTPSHTAEEPENPPTHPKPSGVVDGSHDVMVVEIPPVVATTAGTTVTSGDSTEIPPGITAAPATAVGRLTAVGRVDSMEIPPGTSAAMAVTGNQSTPDGGDSDSTTTRQPATT